MRSAWYECVPNFSEGRNAQTVTALTAAVEAAGLAVLDRHVDPEYNRTVLTFAGPPPTLSEATFRLIEAATAAIDMTRHAGAHPRLGAVDVCPFIALDPDREEQCIRDVRTLAQRVAAELDLCVYLYGKAALTPARHRLVNIRRGEFEAWIGEVGHHSRWAPDFGVGKPKACGPVTLGVRDLMIAINYVLDSDDVGLARRIARRIRHPQGRSAIQARGFRIGNRAHVSCNLMDYRTASPIQVFRRIEELAQPLGAQVRETEIVGLVPRAAMSAEEAATMRVRSFHPGIFLDGWLEG